MSTDSTPEPDTGRLTSLAGSAPTLGDVRAALDRAGFTDVTPRDGPYAPVPPEPHEAEAMRTLGIDPTPENAARVRAVASALAVRSPA